MSANTSQEAEVGGGELKEGKGQKYNEDRAKRRERVQVCVGASENNKV
jgi:hypothetical protein